ncbi:SRPBCC family protein [Solirubrobacter phytolaccae]|uniref:SRPBCC family protein n=1 Tax=Solirubrobacter phytolaccae TaxID=1404360 RepID=A0A9X3SEJ5_9ACTN|nr:SRPBCC family protein [Solirubrobacter phytolaccae]MDA0184955.1 SRPBCC family protein [Solirubrobacter phytolaccae]
MDPITAHVVIDRPREEVFEYLADIANHPEFSDHFTSQWRLTREESYGRGAGARYKLDAPLDRFSWNDMTFIEVKPPFQIVAAGRGGKFNRNETWTTWTLQPSGSATRLEVTTETAPKLPTDRFIEAVTARRVWYKRKLGKALTRVQSILEEDSGRGARATVGGL